jgi:hypothetical protein
VKRGVSLDDFRKQVDFSSYAARFAGDDPVRRNAFDSFYVGAAAPRAYEEAKSEATPASGNRAP